MNEMWGEFLFTHFYRTLAEQTGVPFSEKTWNACLDAERFAWSNSAEAMLDAYEQIKNREQAAVFL